MPVLAIVMAVVTMTPFFVGLVLVMPVLGVTIIMVAANELLLVVFAAEMVIVAAVFVVMQVRLRLVDHYFMAVIKVEIMIAGGQFMGKDPAAFALIHELVVRNIIVRLNIGNIVIFHMIVTCRAPRRLNTNVDGKLDLCLNGMGKSDADEDGACQEKLFHTF